MKYAHLRLILLMSFVILDVHISAASNISGDTVIIDGKYKSHHEIRTLSNSVNVEYRCIRNNLPLVDIFTLSLDLKGHPTSMRMISKDKPGTYKVRINYEERINFIRLVLWNIANNYNLSHLHQIFICPSDFGDAFIQINREINKNKKRTNYTISSLFKNKNNKIISDISRILDDYNLSIKEVIIEDEILKYSREEYLKLFNYSEEINTLPRVFYEPIRILLVIYNKE